MDTPTPRPGFGDSKVYADPTIQARIDALNSIPHPRAPYDDVAGAFARQMVIAGSVPMAESMDSFQRSLRALGKAVHEADMNMPRPHPYRNNHSRLTPSQKAAQRAKNKAARAARKRNR